jgi:uncharacterized protein with PIN domain
MIIILDVSASVEILLNRENANRLKEKIATADTVVAPEIYINDGILVTVDKRLKSLCKKLKIDCE